MSIIIKTPQPDTEERLVLVPPESVSRSVEGVSQPGACDLAVHTNNARDATPADLARGGYVPVERAEKAEWSARVARMAMENEHQDREGVRIRKDLGTQDAPCPCDTDPEQGMGMHSPPCPLHEAARALRRKTSWEDAAHTMDGELKAAITRAEKAERERDDAVAAHRSALAEQTARADTNFRAALKVQGDMTDLRVALSAAESANAEGHELLAAETARAEKAEGLLIQRETELRLAREDGAAVERQMREARSAADASFVRANRAEMRAEKAERERDEALLRAHTGVVHYEILRQSGEEAARQRDEARAELERLTAPAEGSEGEPTDEELLATANAAWTADMSTAADARRALFRAGVAHKRARQQPAKDRATDEARPLREVSAELEAMRTTHDERDRVYVGAIASDDELVTVYRRAAEPLGDEHGVSLRDLVRRCQARGVLAVAARVRQERCLVAQAVARGWYIYLCPQKNDPSKWDIETGRVIAGRSDGGAILHGVPAADVPATLARLLGEVSRG